MQQRITRPMAIGMSAALATAGIATQVMAQDGADPDGITTIAAGLSNPRGFDWSPTARSTWRRPAGAGTTIWHPSRASRSTTA